MIGELDQIIVRLEIVKDLVENDDVADDLNGIINDLCEWEDKNFQEETDDN